MKVPFVHAHVFWVPWWDVDHHVYGCPIQVTLHTRHWGVMVRPFSGFAQGGDRRGEIEWRRTRQGPSPYEWEHAAKWVMDDELPEIWKSVHGHWLARQYCRNCLEPLTDPTRCPEGDQADIARMWTVRYWRARVRHPHQRTAYCVVCLHDVEGCTAVHGGRHVTAPAAWFVFPRHLWAVHTVKRNRCRIRAKDMQEVEIE